MRGSGPPLQAVHGESAVGPVGMARLWISPAGLPLPRALRLAAPASTGKLLDSRALFRPAMAQSLQPHPWRPGDPPPPWPPAAAPPLPLLIDSRLPLPPSEGLLAHLTPEERQRHGAYRLPADRLRFLLGRASLRLLLGHWLRQPPNAIPLLAGPHGKPHCPSPAAPAFNVSHSGDLILLAFHPAHPVGVDVERARPDLAWEPIARRVLDPAERTALHALPAADQVPAFLVAWCRLEARLKARGVGLGGAALPQEHDPGLEPHGSALVWEVRVPPGYAAAVALEAPSSRSHPPHGGEARGVP